jgi:hypothetical protein
VVKNELRRKAQLSGIVMTQNNLRILKSARAHA